MTIVEGKRRGRPKKAIRVDKFYADVRQRVELLVNLTFYRDLFRGKQRN